MKGTAVKPEFFNNLPTLVKEANKEKQSGVSDEERHLYRLSNHQGWRILKEFSEDLLVDLDQFNEQAIANGATREQIGDNAIVISLTKGIIRKILNKVQDAKEAVEKPDGTTE